MTWAVLTGGLLLACSPHPDFEAGGSEPVFEAQLTEGAQAHDPGRDLMLYSAGAHSLRLGQDEAVLDDEYRAPVFIPCLAGDKGQWVRQWADTHCVVFTDAVVDPHDALLAVARFGEDWQLGRVYERVFIERVYLHLEPTPVVFRRVSS
jgi:hypothetical protein